MSKRDAHAKRSRTANARVIEPSRSPSSSSRPICVCTDPLFPLFATIMTTDAKPQNRAQVCVKFIVVGGGIAGLATASTLRKAGHDVLVLEKGNGKIKVRNTCSHTSVHGTDRSPPNMTKLLHKWGLGPVLQEKAHKCDKFIFKNGNSGDLIGAMNMGQEFLKDLVADFMFLQHKDLYTMLYQLTVKEGVEFRFNATVVDADSEQVSVTLDSGETLFGDVIVGADGYDSLLRQVVTDSDDEPPDVNDRHVIVTFTIPVHLMEEDEELRSLLNIREWVIWLGEGYIMNANMLVGGKDFTATIIHNYYGARQPEDQDWTESRTLESCGIHLMLKLATSLSSRIYVRRPPPEDFVCNNSRVVLTGESAHPMLPASNHGVALVLEDAQTLGCLFSRLRSRDHVSQLLTAYEEIRHPHCSDTQMWDYQQRLGMKVPVGPQQDGRDAILRQTMAYGDWDHMEETTFRSVWGNELTLFAYDATDKVDDWWGQYGSSTMEVKVSMGDVAFS
ncbi:hypothetical protein BDZ97DRAFT_1906399 [Flammula alnicola]|nr:hypothetical protein BDZ97DRAFT_1906399 [Flammula alnicola]